MRILPFLMLFIYTFSEVSAQPEYVLVGKVGGISGEATQYKILNNGKVYKGSGFVDIVFTHRGKIKKSEAKKLCNDAAAISDTSFSHPGNVYYFVKIVGEKTDIKYTWGDPGFNLPDTLGELYRSTMVKVANLRYKPVKKHTK